MIQPSVQGASARQAGLTIQLMQAGSVPAGRQAGNGGGIVAMASFVAVAIAFLRDPVRMVVAAGVVLFSKAQAVESLLTSVQFTRTWGQGLSNGFLASPGYAIWSDYWNKRRRDGNERPT